MRGIRNYLGNGKVPLLPVWKGIYIRNRPEATCKYLQETWLTLVQGYRDS